MFFTARQLLDRYTPPTCTLELWVTRSRFRPFLKPDRSQDRSQDWPQDWPQDWQFELRFDDPRMPEDRQIALQGDRQQLDHLYEILGDYLQNFLQETRRLWTVSSVGEDSSGNVGLVEPSEVSAIAPTQPFFRSQGLLSHELHGGTLTATASPAIVTLSTSQLFDLSHALDDYQRDRHQLLHPHPAPTQRPGWLIPGGIAIAIGLLALIFGQEQWSNLFIPSTLNSAQENTPENSAPSPNAILPVPLPPNRLLPSPNLAPVLANRDPLPLPPPATPGDPLARSSNNPLPNTRLRVLPPLPVAPPAPSLPAGTTSTVGLNPLAAGVLNIPALPSGKDAKISPLTRLPSPPPLLSPLRSSGGDSPTSAIAFRASPGEALPRDRRSPRPFPPAQTRLLDTIPQVAEVRIYFQGKWQKPSDLNQSLEYRLIINPNGSLAKIVPLGKAAIIYQPQVGMPTIGEVFVSPLRQKEEQTIRLVLDLEGKVATFLE